MMRRSGLLACLFFASVSAAGAADLKPKPASFRNHVIPMMTRVGCNAGACHGALAGKGGFKLSLRGYDPESEERA